MKATNPRGAGRKQALTKQQTIQLLRRHQGGESVTALAAEAGVSRQTLSGYFSKNKEKAPGEADVCGSLAKWRKLNAAFCQQGVPVEDYTLRLEFMCLDELCSVILVDFAHRQVQVAHYTMDVMHRAFGLKRHPDWEDFQHFLEGRCVPRSREGLRDVLADFGLDFYDPLAIVHVTEGRMAEDLQWLRLVRYAAGIGGDGHGDTTGQIK